MGNSTRFKVLNRDGFRCRYCGKEATEKSLEVDHIIPRSRGGSNEMSNLITACFECNRGKRDKLIIQEVSDVPVSELTKAAAKEYAKRLQQDDEVNIYINYFTQKAPHVHELTPKQKSLFKQYVSKFEPFYIFDSIDIAVSKYLPDWANDYHYDDAIKKIGGICFNKQQKDTANG